MSLQVTDSDVVSDELRLSEPEGRPSDERLRELSPQRLAQVSVEVIRSGQADSGAYVASPSFSQYGYGWLRDGSYCALAMQSAGEWESAQRFHAWVARSVAAQEALLTAALPKLRAGQVVPGDQLLPTRYNLDGSVENDRNDWPNFQLDGYGTWLFALCSAQSGGVTIAGDLLTAAHRVADYIAAAWRLPCYDYWEESPQFLHTSTLAALAAGLKASSRLFAESSYADEAERVMQYLEAHCVSDGAFVKNNGDTRVDGSLVSLAVPFGLVSDDDPRYAKTIRRIRHELSSPTGGIRRYVGDEYYGGSPWILLTAWLGWHDRLVGDKSGYQLALDWVLRNTGPGGSLPEQIVSEPQFPERVAVWEQRWGSVADPLLWSHAQYLLMLYGQGPMSWD